MFRLPDGNWEHISFDVFDTLLTRDSVSPKGTLLLTKRNFGNRTPLFWRINAEHLIRIFNGTFRQGRETNFNQISKLVSSSFLDSETQADKAVLNARPIGLRLLNEALAKGAKVSFISDTTYSSDEIGELLSSAGIPVAGPIFVSSEYFKTKREGQLFDLVRDSSNLNVNRWLHIGDDLRADIDSPNSRGISTLYIPKQIDMLREFLHKDHLDRMFESNNLSGLLTLGILCGEVEIDERFVTDDYYRLGVSVIGPLVSGFAEWISDQTKTADSITFLGRDGFLPKAVFDLMKPSDNRSVYSQVSRRNLIVPAWLGVKKNPNEFIRRLPMLKEEDTHAFLLRLGLTANSSKIMEPNSEISLSKILESDEIQSQASKEYMDISNLISQLSRTEIVVDVGWRATLQEAIQILTGKKVQGLYLGTSATSFISAPGVKGWLTNSGRPRKFGKILRQSIGLIERSFSEQVPSLMGGNLQQSEFKVDYKISSIQDGAIKFAQIWHEKSTAYQVSMDKDTAMSGLCAAMMKPRDVDLKVIGEIGNEHAPRVEAKHDETLIPVLGETKSKLMDFPSPIESGANWPIGYKNAVLGLVAGNGGKANRLEVLIWQSKGSFSNLKRFGLRNAVSLISRKFN